MEAFHIYVFSDKFRNNLIACARIEVYSMTYFKIKTKAGVEKPFELTFTSGSDYPACTVQCFSSNPALVYSPAGNLERSLIRVTPNSTTKIDMMAKAFTAAQQNVRVQCVDTSGNRNVIASWLVCLQCERPAIKEEFDITCPAGRRSYQSFVFVNPLNEFALFEFTSSHPEIMVIRTKQMSFEGKEKKYIKLMFSAQAKTGEDEVLLYVNDDKGKVSQCDLFKILYTS